jgi:hypothetical protein
MEMSMSGAQYQFSGLDDAEVYAPDLPAGKHLFKVVENDIFTHEGNTHVNVVGEVLETNSREVKVGGEYRAKIPFLHSIKYPKSGKGLKLLRTYLAAAVGVPADGPPPADVAKSWDELADLVINQDPKAMEGDVIYVIATPSKNPEYCNYKFLPPPSQE